MDIITLALAKKFATKVAAGFSSVEVDGMDIIFTLNDGSQVTLTVPEPEDGVSVTDLDIDNNNNLICTLSDGSTVNAGELPMAIPEKGVDYWTEEDKQEIKTYVDDVTSNAFAAELDEENFTLLLKRVGSSYHDQMADISTSLDEISGEVI